MHESTHGTALDNDLPIPDRWPQRVITATAATIALLALAFAACGPGPADADPRPRSLDPLEQFVVVRMTYPPETYILRPGHDSSVGSYARGTPTR
ncbi:MULTISPECIES: hypothetical protein [unclassified Nocardia]|uniref:hypothetical protein n=1 Tax=unclassified Nocardia TaxID=2637762 RepID=UPI0035E389BA